MKILQIGKTYGQTKRAIANATVNENGEIPMLTGTHKDHKDPKEGFKMCPIVNAMNGPKCAPSGMVSDILEGVIENIGSTSVCKSTEELLYTFEEYNNTIDKDVAEKNFNRKRKVIGSIDAKALYPSIEEDRAADIVAEIILDTDVKFEGLDNNELGKYLCKNMNT